jgi:hypothetical protein
VDAGAPEQPERGSGVDSRPGLRDLYTDDPDDIFDAGEDPGPGLKGEPGDGAGERVVGEPSSDGPVDWLHAYEVVGVGDGLVRLHNPSRRCGIGSGHDRTGRGDLHADRQQHHDLLDRRFAVIHLLKGPDGAPHAGARLLIVLNGQETKVNVQVGETFPVGEETWRLDEVTMPEDRRFHRDDQPHRLTTPSPRWQCHVDSGRTVERDMYHFLRANRVVAREPGSRLAARSGTGRVGAQCRKACWGSN